MLKLMSLYVTELPSSDQAISQGKAHPSQDYDRHRWCDRSQLEQLDEGGLHKPTHKWTLDLLDIPFRKLKLRHSKQHLKQHLKQHSNQHSNQHGTLIKSKPFISIAMSDCTFRSISLEALLTVTLTHLRHIESAT
jgi:hypothetical protein